MLAFGSVEAADFGDYSSASWEHRNEASSSSAVVQRRVIMPVHVYQMGFQKVCAPHNVTKKTLFLIRMVEDTPS